ncbi:hypothetical protein GGR50DRAFT_685077 [Xylaria sp. CBS 124048]|nr:hypothetical protein GGR50DRAFT_685077 [Xylaria sp. CBS 124048]
MPPKFLLRLTRSPGRALALILIIFVIHQLLTFQSSPATTRPAKKEEADPCEGLEGLEDVFVTLRTGTTEAPKKLPAHYATTLRCVPHYELYSDFEEDIEGHRVYDVLDEVDPDIVATHPDFVYYNRLRGKGRTAFTDEEMAEWAAAKNTNGGRDSPGWRLDKWKFLPLADKALRLRPQAKWFVFIESDTYMLWKPLLAWLKHYDPSKPWYLGQQMQIGDVVFAYGGAGFVISQPALRMVVEHRNANLAFYDDFTANHWAGDCVLGKALLDAGVPLTWAYPTLSNEDPADTNFDSDFSGPEKHPWCYYAASYHHLPSAEYQTFYNFEHNWYETNQTLLRHKDVFFNYVLPRIASEREDWDNHSEDEKTAESSFKACRRACESDPDCMQFSVTGYTCKTSSTLTLGRRASAAEQVKSGWMLDRLDAFIERMESRCGGNQQQHDWALPE